MGFLEAKLDAVASGAWLSLNESLVGVLRLGGFKIGVRLGFVGFSVLRDRLWFCGSSS